MTFPFVTRTIFFIISVLGMRCPCRHLRTAETDAPRFLANSGDVSWCLIRYWLSVIMKWDMPRIVLFVNKKVFDFPQIVSYT